MGARRTLNSEMVGKITHVAFFWPLPNLGEDMAATIDAEMEALSHDLRTRFDGDSQLGGATTDMYLEYATPDIVNVSGASFLAVVWTIVDDFTEYTLAP